jgi:hypothetical protein
VKKRAHKMQAQPAGNLDKGQGSVQYGNNRMILPGRAYSAGKRRQE